MYQEPLIYGYASYSDLSKSWMPPRMPKQPSNPTMWGIIVVISILSCAKLVGNIFFLFICFSILSIPPTLLYNLLMYIPRYPFLKWDSGIDTCKGNWVVVLKT